MSSTVPPAARSCRRRRRSRPPASALGTFAGGSVVEYFGRCWPTFWTNSGQHLGRFRSMFAKLDQTFPKSRLPGQRSGATLRQPLRNLPATCGQLRSAPGSRWAIFRDVWRATVRPGGSLGSGSSRRIFRSKVLVGRHFSRRRSIARKRKPDPKLAKCGALVLGESLFPSRASFACGRHNMW